MSVLAIRSNVKLIPAVQVLLGACFIGLMAQIKIPLFFTPVPFTLQPIGVMLVAATLGRHKGVLAVLGYLVQGWIGLPVWAGGAAGFTHFMGPTGGYLIGYIPQVWMIGWFLEKKHSFVNSALIFSASIFLQLGLGSLWLAQFVGIKNCFALGFYPFVIGDLIKGLLVAGMVNWSQNEN